MAISRVLILDDSPEMRALLRLAIELDHPAVEVREAAGLSQALDLMADWSPDAMIVDMMMQEADGVEAVGRLRPLRPDARIVMFSSAPYGAAAEQAIDLGADVYIEKTQGHQAVLAAIGL